MVFTGTCSEKLSGGLKSTQIGDGDERVKRIPVLISVRRLTSDQVIPDFVQVALSSEAGMNSCD